MASAVGAAGMKRKRAESSSTSSSSSEINYEVFLNFRGPDTREGFTDHLHDRLRGAGIRVFRDDEDLPAGQEIKPELKKAIKRSRISIAILSKNYSQSKHCLMELVQMWECSKSRKHTIIPIFYDVSPSDVRDQDGDFIRSIDQLATKGAKADTITYWKKVLGNIGELRGYERTNVKGYESQLLDDVFRCVSHVLKKDHQLVTDKPVGIAHHIQEMMTKLGVVSAQGQGMNVCGEDVRVISICGMPGVGKTTLARIVFNDIKELFDGCSFLEDMNPEEIEASQKLLISNLQNDKREYLRSYTENIKVLSSAFIGRKVLIVLDNVCTIKQIEALAGKFAWFGLGSRIIMTTRKQNFVKDFEFGEEDEDRGAEEYEVHPLEHRHALKLFRMHAFRGGAEPDVSEYVSYYSDIVEALRGHPMAIVLWAKYLKKKDIKIWRFTRDSLRDNPKEGEVKAALKALYDSLNYATREIFLDIACFFIGKDWRIPSCMWEAYMWEACGRHPFIEVKDLCDMYLLEIGKNNELRMHNLVRGFGREIVKDKDRCKRCRYWNQSAALPVPEDVQVSFSKEK